MKIERFVPARDASTAAQPEEKQGAGGAGLRFRNGLLAAFGLRGQNMPDAQPDSARGLVVAESTVVLLDKKAWIPTFLAPRDMSLRIPAIS